ncbi:MAG: tryptophan--tRNA ligase, partial [Clostridia bacterium]
DPTKLKQKTYELLSLYLACGIDPEKSIVFIQSHVPAHAELAWVLNTVTYIGELNRMTQFKEKCKSHTDNINMGLMDYPVLMASDILLYQTDYVPVGIDQKQHLEITRTIAERFNARYGDTFVVPEAKINKVGAKIMSLADPKLKMSKSDENENAFISMMDSPEIIMRKMKRAVTDSGEEIKFDQITKAGISNLLTIYSLMTNKNLKEIEQDFIGCGYGTFKDRVAETVIEGIKNIQSEQKRLYNDKAYLESVIKSGAEKASYLARKTLSKVYRKLGFIPR